MRSDTTSSGHLGLYRNVAIGVGILTTAAIGLAAMGNTYVADLPDLRLMIFGGTVLLGFLSLMLLRYGYFLLKRSVQSAAAANNVLLASAHQDSLTGALTRSYFLEELKGLVHHGSRHAVGYIQLDMDHLKQLNDGSGHAAGDAALAHLVARVRKALPDAMIGRLGGDEFGIAIIGCDSRKAIRRVCEQILLELETPVTIAARHVRLGATMGIALAPADATSVDELISKADLALYEGKKQGRNTVVLFEENMHRDERHQRYIERELRAAILMNELDLYYQPIFESDGVTLRSYESLVRWEHPVRGTISPGDFIHIAEKSDLIDKLGEWVLRRACRDMAALDAPSIAVNVSAAQLRRSDFAERFAAILATADIDGARLTVEITETVPLAANGVEKANLDALRALNVKIAIDDFGAGNASLGYIKQFSFDVLKIDRSYVEGITVNRLDAMMVSAICRIARTAGMEVVAEGVETEEQLAILRGAGSIALQGFLLGRPQPLRRILADKTAREDMVSAA